MDSPTLHRDPPAALGPLASSVHSAQAQGLLRQPETVAHLLYGIRGALCRTVEGNAGNPLTAWALRSPVYWDHFEMQIKEVLLTSFCGLEPTLCHAVRDQIETTLADLKRRYGSS